MERMKFEQEIEKRMEKETGKKYEVRRKKITKNNGQVLTALQVRMRGERAGALLYLEKPMDLLDQPLDEESLLAVATEKVLDFVRYGAEFPLTEEEIDRFLFWEKARKQVVFRFVNREWNASQLSEMPYREYLDLAVVYSVCFPRGEDIYLGRVDNTHLELWGIAEEELYQAAMENTPTLLGEQLVELRKVLKEMSPCMPWVEDERDDDFNQPELYILSNRVGTQGAIAVLYSEKVKELAERKRSDLYLLPASVHELLAMPVNSGMPAEAILAMVRMVNIQDVQPMERLSNNIYRYCRKTGEVMVIRNATEDRKDEI